MDDRPSRELQHGAPATLDLVDLRRGAADRGTWMPFASSGAYEHPHWWNRVPYAAADPWYVQVLEAGIEVGRVQLDQKVHIEHYANVPAIGSERLEIQLIEVAAAARGRGVGTRVVRGLAERHPDRRLVAYSEGADGFWASLGWSRFDNPDGRYRALFIQPVR
ncbi:hypothetical protein [Rhodococcus qingshengii]|uniref:hypothetical protein n=1 Tax=Rhodococcus qingshengii TaxID=334542 RepID=UPI0007E536A0|nr:hypothetical protein [Rhodococcus qingshengii]